MKIEVVFLSGSLQLSGSTTWLNTLIKGFEQQNINCIHLVTGVPSSIKSSATQVVYTGRPRQQLRLRLMRWLQLHKLCRNLYREQETKFYTQRTEQLLESQLAKKVLVIKDFTTYLPTYFKTDRFLITAVLHQQYAELQLGYFYHQLCAVSEAVKQKSNQLGFNVTQVIYNPLDIEQLEHLADEYQPDEQNYLVFVGKLHREKGVVELLESYHQLLQQNNIDLKLLYIGEGKDQQLLQNYINKHNLADWVKLKGFQTNPYPYIKHAKLLVLPSYSEAMGYVAIEAAALKTPYLVSNFAAASEFFPPAHTFALHDRQLECKDMRHKIVSLLNEPQYQLKAGIIEKMQLDSVVSIFYNQLKTQE